MAKAAYCLKNQTLTLIGFESKEAQRAVMAGEK